MRFALPTFAVLLSSRIVLLAAPPQDFEDLRDHGPHLEQVIKETAPDRFSQPYRFRSLRGSTNEQIMKWMGEGKQLEQLESDLFQPITPRGWQAVKPEEAVRMLVEANRTRSERENSPLGIPRLKEPFPASGTIAFSGKYHETSTASFTVSWLLKWSPERAWLAQTVDVFRSGMRVSRGFWETPDLALQWLDLPPQDALQMAKIICLLKDCSIKRKEELPESHFDWGDSDVLTFRGEGPALSFEIKARAFSFAQVHESYLLSYWSQNSALNLALHLAPKSLRERATAKWSEWDEDKISMAKNLSESLPLLASTNPPLALEAVRVIGYRGVIALAPVLAEMEKALPAPTPRERRLLELDRTIDQQVKKLGYPALYYRYRQRQNFSEMIRNEELELSPEEIEMFAEARDPKFVEVDASYREIGELNSLQTLEERRVVKLRAALVKAQRQLAAWNDAAALRKWMLEELNVYDSAWAYQRLRELDAGEALAALEACVRLASPPLSKRSDTLSELERLAPERARKLAEALPEEARDSVRWIFERHDEKPADGQRLKELLQLAEDPKQKREERRTAIDDLVPSEQPRKYPDTAVDDALVRLATKLEEQASPESVAAAALDGLAWRDAARHWEVLEKAADQLNQDILTCMAAAAAKEPAKFSSRLVALLKPHLQPGESWMEMAPWVAWTGNARALKPDIEAVATSDADDYEGAPPQRVHAARIVASLWNEQDAVTRARMLAALGVARPSVIETSWREPEPSMRKHAEAELAATLKELSAKEQAEFSEFLDWLKTRPELAPGRYPPQWQTDEQTARAWLTTVRELAEKAGK